MWQVSSDILGLHGWVASCKLQELNILCWVWSMKTIKTIKRPPPQVLHQELTFCHPEARHGAESSGSGEVGRTRTVLYNCDDEG